MKILVNSASCIKNNNIIFENLSIELNDGDICLIKGPNGSGKTTFIRSLCGIQTLESGNIFIDNIDIQNQSSCLKENLVYIGHKYSLNPNLTVKENIEYLCSFDSTVEIISNSIINEAMIYFDILKYKNFLVSDLSEGNKKKTSLSRLFVTKKNFWVLDEPLNNLDTQSIDLVLKLIVNHQEKGGISVSSSHYNFLEHKKNIKYLEMNN